MQSNKMVIGSSNGSENKVKLSLTIDQIAKLLTGQAEITMTCVFENKEYPRGDDTEKNNDHKIVEMPISDNMKKQIIEQLEEKKVIKKRGRPSKPASEKRESKKAYDVKYQKERYKSDPAFKEKRISKSLEYYYDKKIGV